MKLKGAINIFRDPFICFNLKTSQISSKPTLKFPPKYFECDPLAKEDGNL